MALTYSAKYLAAIPDADLEAALEAEAQKGPASDLAAYGREVSRRLKERNPQRNGTRAAYLRGFTLRASLIAWWAHAAAVALLMLIGVAMIDSTWGPDRDSAYKPLLVAASLAAGVVVVRWLISGIWRFGPPRPAASR